MRVRLPGLANEPPRLVLRFAALTAAAALLAGGAILWSLRHYAVARAEHRAGDDARSFTIGLRGRLRPSDFARPASGSRLEALDALFLPRLGSGGIVRAALYNRRARITYSTEHSLIGRVAPHPDLLEALGGRAVSEVSTLDHDVGGGGPKVLEAYTPFRLASGRSPGVVALYQDYAPLAREARETIVPVSIALALALLGLYAALFPILRQVTARLRKQMKEIEYQALHDGLTGLPNRALFQDRAEQAVLAAARDGTRFAVLLIDLDRLKEVNDALGHDSGDLLLQQAGRRLLDRTRASDTVARLGGDEFAVLARAVDGPPAAVALARDIRTMLEEPFRLDGLTLQADASIGIAVYPEHGNDSGALIRHADVAMYSAKEAQSGIEVYRPEHDQTSVARLRLLGELRHAIEDGQLVLDYQPKVELESGDVRSVEALVRWRHPRHGLLGPDRFIALAEGTGLIRPLTRYVLDAAVRQCREWEDAGLAVCMAVNLSGRDLLDVELPDEVAAILARWSLDPRRLELEITERTILGDPTRARAVLDRLKEIGVRLAIDDFGAGYSSLGYLKRLPLDVLKIDRSFVASMETSDDDAVIVRSTIDLAHNLGLRVVAEGVESESVRAALAARGCDAAQGYHFARPMAAAELEEWLIRRRSSGKPARDCWELRSAGAEVGA